VPNITQRQSSIFMITGELLCTSKKLTRITIQIHNLLAQKRKRKKEPCKKKKLRIAHCEESLIKSSVLDCCLALYFSNSCLQRGQQDIIRSHWSTHLRWNIWEHGNCLTSSMSLYLARHIQHSCQYHNTNIRRRKEKSLGRWSSMAFQLMLWLHADKVV